MQSLLHRWTPLRYQKKLEEPFRDKLIALECSRKDCEAQGLPVGMQNEEAHSAKKLPFAAIHFRLAASRKRVS